VEPIASATSRAQCAAHPLSVAEGLCPRCGAFQCRGCIQATAAGRCPSCAHPVPRERSKEAEWALGLGLAACASWLSPVLVKGWMGWLGPPAALPVAVVGFASRHRARAGPARPRVAVSPEVDKRRPLGQWYPVGSRGAPGRRTALLLLAVAVSSASGLEPRP